MITRVPVAVLLLVTGASLAAAQVRWSEALLREKPEWYASAQARAVADSVIQYQSPQGGWPKSTDLAAPPSSEAVPFERANTIDNGATTTPMQFLARMVQATGDARYRKAFERGWDYLLAAQYANGGWPQYFPLRQGYYAHITYNDHAMVNVLTLLRDGAAGNPPYSFLHEARRVRAAAAVSRGLQVILRTQVKQDGRLTAWCAQHDETTLQPAWGRTYEPPSLSSAESVGIVRFLMEIERPAPEVIAAIEGAVAWLQSVKIDGWRVQEFTGEDGRRDRRAVADRSAAPLWARFYEWGTNRPIFLGRDSITRYDFNEIERERRVGYVYLGDWPANLLANDFPRWRAKRRTAGADSGALTGQRHRVIVSSDIGGTDPDDFQSMVHLLLYADVFDVEGLVSSPYGLGRREHILQVIDDYARDYPNLKTYSAKYPTPETLRAITKQGALESPGSAGVGQPTEGSDWIVKCARRADPRPLYVLVWGGIEDLAQALHDAPDILPKLRVYFIGGPNKMWSVDAYNYIERNHPKLWMIEANETYRGWFTGGNQAGEWGNVPFVAAHVAGRGALGTFFATLLKGTIKMGDSPSVGYLLRGTPEDPSQPGWGGKFVRIWDGRKTIFDRLTSEADQAEAFGVVEFALPIPAGMTRQNSARMIFDGRIPAAATIDGGVLRFRFSPRDAKVWPYVIRSDFAGLDGQTGKFTAIPPPPERTSRPSLTHSNWWADDPDPAAAEGVHSGAKSVSRWREEFLADFAARLRRCTTPASHEPRANQ